MTLVNDSRPISTGARAAPRPDGFVGIARLAGPGLLPITLFARLASSMTPIAVLGFAATTSGSFTTAGLTVTGTAVGTAVGSPVIGRAADRLGQRTVALAAALANAAALVALPVVALTADGTTPTALLVALGLLVGLTAPPVGAMSRARWLGLSRRLRATGRRDDGADLTRIAMSAEGLADEVAYIAGPALAGLLAAFAGPSAALLAAAAIVGAGGTAFALHHTHALAREATEVALGAPGDARGRLRMAPLARLLVVPLAAMSMVGVLFGASQTALTAFGHAIDQPSAGGLLYAVMAISSAGSAVALTRVPARFGPRLRCLVAGCGLLVGVLLMTGAAVVSSTGWMVAAVLFTGVFVSPALITLNTLVGATAPPAEVATAMALLSSAVVAGVALGAAVAGALADGFAAPGAFGTAAAGLLVLVAICLWAPGEDR